MQTLNGRIVNHAIEIEGDHGWEKLHSNHSIPTTLDEIKEDVFKPFVVFEYVSNFSATHGLMANSADEALQEYSELGIEAEDLQGVALIKF